MLLVATSVRLQAPVLQQVPGKRPFWPMDRQPALVLRQHLVKRRLLRLAHRRAWEPPLLSQVVGRPVLPQALV